jgi:hypothetical protein
MWTRGESPRVRASVESAGKVSWWLRPWVIIVSAVVLAGVAVGLAVWASRIAHGDSDDGFAQSVVGPLLTFAGAVLITGVVGLVVGAARDRDEQLRSDGEKRAEMERDHRAFLESQIVALWSVHDRLKTSAVLISAHRTALTYSTQMEEIIAARTRLSDVEDTIRRRMDPLLTKDDFACFEKYVQQALSFLHPLVDEYRQHYLDQVSYAQRVDEARNKKLDEEKNYDPSRRSTLAWKALKNESHFPRLRTVRDFGGLDAYQLREGSSVWKNAVMALEFLTPLRNAIEVLVECRTSPPDSSTLVVSKRRATS